MELLELIRTKLSSSSAAIFDATGGNANVSLEFGFAEGRSIPRHIYISKHGATRRSSKQSSIIADLQGKVRNIYKQESVLARLLENFCRAHPYQIKFDKAMKKNLQRQSQGNKIKYRKLAVKIIHRLDHTVSVRRSDVLQDMEADSYKEDEINKVIKILHNERLVRSGMGGHSYIEIA